MSDTRIALYREDFQGLGFEWVLKGLNIPDSKWTDIKSVELSVDGFCLNDDKGQMLPNDTLVFLFRKTLADYLKENKYLTPDETEKIEILSYRLYNIVANINRVEDWEEWATRGGIYETKKEKE